MEKKTSVAHGTVPANGADHSEYTGLLGQWRNIFKFKFVVFCHHLEIDLNVDDSSCT